MDTNCQKKCPKCGHYCMTTEKEHKAFPAGLHVCDNAHVWDNEGNTE